MHPILATLQVNSFLAEVPSMMLHSCIGQKNRLMGKTKFREACQTKGAAAGINVAKHAAGPFVIPLVNHRQGHRPGTLPAWQTMRAALVLCTV